MLTLTHEAPASMGAPGSPGACSTAPASRCLIPTLWGSQTAWVRLLVQSHPEKPQTVPQEHPRPDRVAVPSVSGLTCTAPHCRCLSKLLGFSFLVFSFCFNGPCTDDPFGTPCACVCESPPAGPSGPTRASTRARCIYCHYKAHLPI